MADVSAQINGFISPALLTIVGFFLLKFYNLVEKVKDQTTQILIKMASDGEKMESIKSQIKWLEDELEKLKNFVTSNKQI